eukprot:394787_1
MTWLSLYCTVLLIPVLLIPVTSNIIGPTGDLTCTKTKWTAINGNWSFPKACVYENTNKISDAMAWIGAGNPSSLLWSGYTVQMRMTPTDTSSSGGNGGLAFNIVDVGQCYAISIFPTFRANRIEIHMGKWNYNYQTVATWFIEEKYTQGQSFDIEAVISTKVNVTVQVYVNDHFIGTWVENQSPMWTKGSIGVRNYQLPAVYTKICVNGCEDEEIEDDALHGVGWTFVVMWCCSVLLYCGIGYCINVRESQNWRNYRRNIPNLIFWEQFVRHVKAGCEVTCECCQGLSNSVYHRMK